MSPAAFTRRRVFHRARIIALCLAAAGCGASEPSGTKVNMPTYLFGTLGDRTLDLTELCGGKPQGSVSVYPTTATVGLGILTLGTYTPLEVRVECSKPQHAPRPRAPR